ADLFRAEGFRVMEASNGFTGLRLAEDFDPAVILLDLELPELSGLELLAELRRSRPNRLPRVIVISGSADQRKRESSPQVRRWLQKPFDVEHLLDEVQAATRPSPSVVSIR